MQLNLIAYYNELRKVKVTITYVQHNNDKKTITNNCKKKIHFQIGLMRDGCLLAEESPEKLLQTFQVDYLEDVFLILSRRQNEGRLNQLKTTQEPLDASTVSLNTTQGSTDVNIFESRLI